MAIGPMTIHTQQQSTEQETEFIEFHITMFHSKWIYIFYSNVFFIYHYLDTYSHAGIWFCDINNRWIELFLLIVCIAHNDCGQYHANRRYTERSHFDHLIFSVVGQQNSHKTLFDWYRWVLYFIFGFVLFFYQYLLCFYLLDYATVSSLSSPWPRIRSTAK